MLESANIDIIFEQSPASKYVTKYKNEPQNMKYLDFRTVKVSPEYYIYSDLLRPTPDSPTRPTLSGEKIRFKIKDVDILTGAIMRTTVTSANDLTALTSYNTGATLWNRVTFFHYGKAIYTFVPSYILCRVQESGPSENEMNTSAITSIPIDGTVTTSSEYILPLFAPFFDTKDYYLYTEFYRNLEVELEYSGLLTYNTSATSDYSSITMYLETQKMRLPYEYKNHLYQNMKENKFQRPWYNTRTFTYAMLSGASSNTVYLDNNFMTAKNLYIFIMSSSGYETNINTVTLTVAGNKIFQEDRYSNIYKKYFSPDRLVYWGYDGSCRRIPFGAIQDENRFGYTGGACLSMASYKLDITSSTLSANATMYLIVEFYTEVETDSGNGSLHTNLIY